MTHIYDYIQISKLAEIILSGVMFFYEHIILYQLVLHLFPLLGTQAIVFHYKYDAEEMLTRATTQTDANVFVSVMTRKGVPYSKAKKSVCIQLVCFCMCL